MNTIRSCDCIPTYHYSIKTTRRTQDFQDSRPGIPNADTTPSFKLLQRKLNARPKIVLVLDISGSMEGNKVTKLQQVGYCQVTTTLQLTDVKEDNRDVLTGALPKGTTGGTRLRSRYLLFFKLSFLQPINFEWNKSTFVQIARLLEALRLLNYRGEGNHIILVSDGQSTIPQGTETQVNIQG